MKQAGVEAMFESQGVQHELETQVGLVEFDLAGNAGMAALFEIGARLTLAYPAQHPVFTTQRYLAVCAGADAEVVAEMPVIQVVA